MKCPKCESYNNQVMETRIKDWYIRRRRECHNCGHRFTTYEWVQLEREKT